ncbi:MAG: hypothetical protein K9W46_03300 [Candidatus Heimdallarchaeum endolithica]|uniref:Uncharacterized protein n=1 Tax=Candidatus Heimdallarchaeum endolithica TaxID=2876572 RepID=A0A9Y1BS97_9ARCH|nr:MAG: hypothetical protein K9W46_03300 [Candidatus Heimdallarchaeum endolithica]
MTDDNPIEDKLNAMEKKINELMQQVNSLKEQGQDIDNILNLLQVVVNTLQLSQAPFSVYRKTKSLTQKIVEKNPFLKYDEISRVIIKALERKGSMNLSQLTEAVRKERGTASRRIIRERVDKLLSKGLLIEDDEGFGRRIKINKKEENK